MQPKMGVCGETDLMVGSKPCSGFEGFEKRLELEFSASSEFSSDHPSTGLRALSRAELDEMLTAAQCTIVSGLSNNCFDSYVLSESSLFVYPFKIVLKTCGTTQVLRAIPSLLASSLHLHLNVTRCKYTRCTFMFPSAQPYPHGSFTDEVKFLDQHFGHLGSGRRSHVMGTKTKFPNWHIYLAGCNNKFDSFTRCEPTYTLDMCMTNLDSARSRQFFNEDGALSGMDMTMAAGINAIIPNAEICDFAFSPCGYSMNSLEGGAHSTVHVTPEDELSYASFEAMGYGPEDKNLQTLVDRVCYVFKPANLAMSIQVSASQALEHCSGSWGLSVCPLGYVCDGTSRQDLPGGIVVVFHTFQAVEAEGQHLKSSVTPLGLSPRNLQVEEFPVVSESMPTKARESAFSASPVASEICSRHGRETLDVFSSLNPVAVGPAPKDIDQFIQRTIADAARPADDPFYVLDLGLVLRLWRAWEALMPRVKPFYSVECNQDPTLLSLLAKAGAGFDVASKAELAVVREVGVSSDRIIFGNPCKLPSHILDAAKHGVLRTTFDSESELCKLSKYHPNAEALLRIRAEEVRTHCPTRMKFGADPEECRLLLGAAQKYGVRIVGVAFHVGSGVCNAASFAEGIASSRRVFDMASMVGLPALKVLDIGGGFVSRGGAGVRFSSAASTVNEALEKHFPKAMGVEVIAEPGRYFAEEPFTLATPVFGNRTRNREGIKTTEYWVNDGTYGSMNCLHYDHAVRFVRAVPGAADGEQKAEDRCQDDQDQGPVFQSTVFGPTCDGHDIIMRDIWLPQLLLGDWLVFPRMGAYTKPAGSSNFNVFGPRDISTVHVYSTSSTYDSDAESESGSYNREHSFRGSECSSNDDFSISAYSTGGNSSDEEF